MSPLSTDATSDHMPATDAWHLLTKLWARARPPPTHSMAHTPEALWMLRHETERPRKTLPHPKVAASPRRVHEGGKNHT